MGLGNLSVAVDGPALTTDQWVSRNLFMLPFVALGGMVIAYIAQWEQKVTARLEKKRGSK
jgi:hypothetical protein